MLMLHESTVYTILLPDLDLQIPPPYRNHHRMALEGSEAHVSCPTTIHILLSLIILMNDLSSDCIDRMSAWSRCKKKRLTFAFRSSFMSFSIVDLLFYLLLWTLEHYNFCMEERIVSCFLFLV